jgi:hypothetical protein
LADFIDRFQNDWIAGRSEAYFESRDKDALPYLAKMIQGPRNNDEIEGPK